MSFFHDAKTMFEDFSSKLGLSDDKHEDHDHPHGNGNNYQPTEHGNERNRYQSFAPSRQGNNAKWYVDGCSYMWAVSMAIEEARESIWILDWWLSPEIYLRRPPSQHENYRLDRMLIAAAERGVKVNIIVYKEVSQILTLNSKHSKDALEVHPNIQVFRHPDHIPHGQAIAAEFQQAGGSFSLHPVDLIRLPADGLRAVYGATDDTILYWAHHEKLCLVDGRLAFLGGLDLCFGRWDTNSHPIADAHPADLDHILFPGQDFNNARIFDFADVANPENNQLDRTKSSRMGWTDVALAIQGPAIHDLRSFFTERWNFIFKEKYEEQRTEKYFALESPHDQAESGESGMEIQVIRSASKWSNGTRTERSIQNAYIETIRNSQHFVYIENQFFITATDDHSKPVRNRIGEAIVERIVRAHREGQRYKIIVIMPAVPAFAGDLRADDSLGTRAIMEYQYHSISRGGHSIIDALRNAGVEEPGQYIRFYNLRNYDRINAGAALDEAEANSGVRYVYARRQHDDVVGAGYGGRGEGTGAYYGRENEDYEGYQQSARNVHNRGAQIDSVSQCYMQDGPSIFGVPWFGSEEAEMDAFVSEELYIHSKLLIADDQIVICGSANLNDRSQLGDHDSEIAVVIQDYNQVDSYMNNEPYQVAAYASSLRRHIFRKHIGLLIHQDPTRPDVNFTPIDRDPNFYDWGSPGDVLVRDVLSDDFDRLWNETANINSQVFTKAFHAIPCDNVRSWEDYDEFFGRLFIPKKGPNDENIPCRYEYGHVVKDEFRDVRELKDWLSRVKGNLVEMPLQFMDKVDFAQEGLSFNAFTDVVYT